MIGDRFAEAVRLASFAHGEQVRKGTNIPYFSHPLAVSALVLQYGGDEDQAIIAVSHDMVEDCGPHWADRLRETFGNRVGDGAVGCSDRGPGIPKADDWRSRKVAYMNHLRGASFDVVLVSCCDKLHNAGCIVDDLETIGPDVFNRFGAGKDGTLWYYNSLMAVFSSRPDLPSALVAKLRATVHRMEALAVPPPTYGFR